MNRRKLLGAAAMAAAVPLARAADKEFEVLLARWRRTKIFTLQVADAMPAEAYTFKPKDGMRTYGEEMQHIGLANGFYLSRFAKGNAPAQSRDTSKAGVQKYLTDTFDFVNNTLQSLTRADLEKTYAAPGGKGPGETGWDLVLNAFIHTAHHRGYAEVYLREKGIVPPEYIA